ncbi:MAG: C4-dicarboxylate transport transcriptional regulatory protein [Labilithrix sp.]|nr:C4-dicarboxylate transport transcriptional regulatory protein [Labilithrix sp.]
MSSSNRLRLLLVEDELEAQGALARALTRAGYEVTTAADAASAIARLDDRQQAAPDLAVIDVVLGTDDRGGLLVLEALRARSTLAPAIIVTAFADVAKVKAALNLGASHLLEKPFRATELLAVIDRLLTARPDPREGVTVAFTRARLTPRESEVALLAVKGLSSPEIAQVLSMSDKTVRQHLSRVYEKHGVSGRGELMHLLFPI